MPRNGDRKRGFDLAERRRRVFAAWCRGRAQHLIAQDEGLHPGQIVRDLDAVLEDIKKQRLDDVDRAKVEMMGRIAQGEAEAWAAFERSKQPRKRTRAKKTTGLGKAGQGTRQDGETVTEGRDGNPRFLEVLKGLWELQARILGLVVGKHELSGPGGKPIEIKDERINSIIRAAAARYGIGLAGPGGVGEADRN